jgi:hypothetical protein
MNGELVTTRLATTALAGAALTEVPLPDGGRTWVVTLPDGDLVSQWTRARDALAGLGLYPVAVTTWGERSWAAADLFNRFYYADAAPEAVIASARTLSAEDALARFRIEGEWAAENWDEIVEVQLEATQRAYGSAPDAAAVAGVPRGDEPALERRLLEWEEALRPTADRAPSVSFDWHQPQDPVGLALLPLSEPGHAAAYLSFYGAEGPGRHEALTRLMCSWQERFGAQLVASWGTMLQFVVSAPPPTLDAAFELAVEHTLVAPCTTLLPGETVRDLARHLWRGERWFLHERP